MTFHCTAADMGFAYDSLDFEGTFRIPVASYDESRTGGGDVG